MDRRFSLHRRYPVSWPPCRDDDDDDDDDGDDDPCNDHNYIHSVNTQPIHASVLANEQVLNL